MVRKVEARFRKPASGQLFARSQVQAEEASRWKDELATRGRVSASIPMAVEDANGVVVMSAVVEWFIAKPQENP